MTTMTTRNGLLRAAAEREFLEFTEGNQETKANLERVMKNLKTQMRFASLLSLLLLMCTAAFGQLTPSGDSYTATATPTKNFGTATTLGVESSETTYIQFNLSSIPAGYTSSDITQATLKLYVNTVTTAGSFNVDYVNGAWTESTITADNAPALGTTIAASVPLVTADKNQYILINVTEAVQAWLSGTANDGIALVGNSPVSATFDSKENTTTSHPAELDIVYAPGSGGGTITGITTSFSSGLMGGGTSGTLNLSLLNTCATKQILQWSGSAWACASPGTGTVTSVGSGAGLTGGPITSSGTLSIATAGVTNAMLANPSLTVTVSTGLTGGGSVALGNSTTLAVDTTKVPLLASANTFTTNQTVNGTVTATSFSGNGASLTGVTAANSGELGGLAPSAYAQLAANNTFTGAQTITNNVSITAGGGNGQALLALGNNLASGIAGSTTSPTYQGIYGSNGATTGAAVGVYGSSSSTAGYGVYGTGGTGVFGADGGVAGGTGVLGQDTSGGGIGVAGSGGYGVYGTDGGRPGIGVYGDDTSAQGTGVVGDGEWGVQGSGALYGVLGTTSGTSEAGFGSGVAGAAFGGSGTGVPYYSGVWGDVGGSPNTSIGVVGTAGENFGAFFENDGSNYTSLIAQNNAASLSSALVFESFGGHFGGKCTIDVSGNLTCSGTVKDVVPVEGGARKVAVYSMQSPENWFEDAGSGQLSGGSAHVALDPTFAQTVNAEVEYHVFLTPNGDSRGLYVSQKTATSFEVREQGGGTSNVAFDYRIMAKRAGYENVRLADLTEESSRLDAEHQKMQSRMHPAVAKSLPKPPAPPKPPAQLKPPVLAKPPVLPNPPLSTHAAMKPVAAEQK